MEKQRIRSLIRQRKNEFTSEELLSLSKTATSSLFERIKEEENCHTVLLYHSLPDEVNTHALIKQLSSIGYKVLLPTVVGDNLELHEYVNDQTLHTSESFGIQESSGPCFSDYTKIDIAIIPGMAFTPNGRRLGRGKGYYDRMLPKLKCPLIGLAFPFQIIDDIPCEPHDVSMNEVIC